jgi:hypothetical protein
MKVPSPHENYPPRWETYCQYVGVAGPQNLGFVGPIADTNRFAARYRTARCFRRVEFDGVTADTADGYSAQCQMLPTYSAFEHFLKCIGRRKNETIDLLSRAERDKVQSRLRDLNGQRELF